MKADLRISVKDFGRDKNLKLLRFRVLHAGRQFWVRRNGAPWPADGRPVSLSKLFAALHQAVVRAVE